jgi:hypothetical protein
MHPIRNKQQTQLFGHIYCYETITTTHSLKKTDGFHTSIEVAPQTPIVKILPLITFDVLNGFTIPLDPRPNQSKCLRAGPSNGAAALDTHKRIRQTIHRHHLSYRDSANPQKSRKASTLPMTVADSKLSTRSSSVIYPAVNLI